MVSQLKGSEWYSIEVENSTRRPFELWLGSKCAYGAYESEYYRMGSVRQPEVGIFHGKLRSADFRSEGRNCFLPKFSQRRRADIPRTSPPIIMDQEIIIIITECLQVLWLKSENRSGVSILTSKSALSIGSFQPLFSRVL